MANDNINNILLPESILSVLFKNNTKDYYCSNRLREGMFLSIVSVSLFCIDWANLVVNSICLVSYVFGLTDCPRSVLFKDFLYSNI